MIKIKVNKNTIYNVQLDSIKTVITQKHEVRFIYFLFYYHSETHTTQIY